jgi:hypothetical protein
MTTGYDSDIFALLTSRQSEMVDRPDKSILVIGAGAIGSNALHVAVSTGFSYITIMDDDKLAVENLFPAFFPYGEPGKMKVDELGAFCLDIGLPLDTHDCRLTVDTTCVLKEKKYDIVICAPDGTKNRRNVWRIRREFSTDDTWWMDTRMGGPLLSVFTFQIGDRLAVADYLTTLEGEDGDLPCGMKATATLTKGFATGFIGQSLIDITMGVTPIYMQRYDLKSRFYMRLDSAPENKEKR